MTPQRLREVLALIGKNQTTVSPDVGFSPRTVRRWAAGKKEVPPLVIEKLERMAAEVEKATKPRKGRAA